MVLRIFTSLFASLLLSFFLNPAYGSSVYDEFLSQVAIYQDAQNQQPDDLIRYDDENGELIRRVLDPALATRMGKDAQLSKAGQEGLKRSIEVFKVIVEAYSEAFMASPAQFEREYLDSFDSFTRMTCAGIAPTFSMDISAIEDETMKKLLESSRALVILAPKLMISVMEQEIAEGRFSPQTEKDARERLVMLQSYMDELGLPRN